MRIQKRCTSGDGIGLSEESQSSTSVYEEDRA